MREQILAALRDGPLNTTELGKAIGWMPMPYQKTDACFAAGRYGAWCDKCRCCHQWKDLHDGGLTFYKIDSSDLQPTQTQMVKHGELVCDRRTHPITWALGPAALPPVDLDELEQVFARGY